MATQGRKDILLNRCAIVIKKSTLIILFLPVRHKLHGFRSKRQMHH